MPLGTGRVTIYQIPSRWKKIVKKDGQKLQNDREALHAGGEPHAQATGHAAVPQVRQDRDGSIGRMRAMKGCTDAVGILVNMALMHSFDWIFTWFLCFY